MHTRTHQTFKHTHTYIYICIHTLLHRHLHRHTCTTSKSKRRWIHIDVYTHIHPQIGTHTHMRAKLHCSIELRGRQSKLANMKRYNSLDQLNHYLADHVHHLAASWCDVMQSSDSRGWLAVLHILSGHQTLLLSHDPFQGWLYLFLSLFKSHTSQHCVNISHLVQISWWMSK